MKPLIVAALMAASAGALAQYPERAITLVVP
jgi:tripartite-type tricarboxylate transporter receptor subunit TctC